jgi:hypothetical protein
MVSGAPKEETLTMNRKKKAKAVKKTKKQAQSLERYGVSRPKLLQSCVFRFGGNEEGDVRVCFFPEREKILIGDLGFGRIAI